MSHIHEDQIRDLAYTLWDEAGRPEGQDKHFWARAERQLSEAGDLDISETQTDVTTMAAVAGLPTH
ncbi:MAG: DUF2934 domain-containing protein [Devosia sp.]